MATGISPLGAFWGGTDEFDVGGRTYLRVEEVIMVMTTRTAPSPRLHPGLGLRLIPIGDSRWRLVDAAGLIIGHVDTVTEARGTRYRALHYHPGSRSFRELGAFWSLDDAVDCLRYAR